jgi:hypothetical protein
MAQPARIVPSGPKQLYAIGEIPPLGHVPEKMYAWVIRKDHHGPPESSMQIEVVPTWPVGDDEACHAACAASSRSPACARRPIRSATISTASNPVGAACSGKIRMSKDAIASPINS